MHDPQTTPPQVGQHVPFKQEGWGAALFVIFLVAASIATATYVHTKTYKHPTDVRFEAKGSAASHE